MASFKKDGSSSAKETQDVKKKAKPSGEEKKKAEKNKKTDFVQNYMGIRQIIGGMIFMENGQIVGIQEILPVNFEQKSVSERNYIYDTFKGFFRIAPQKIHFKMRTEKADIDKICNNIRKSNEDETNPVVLKRIDEYISFVKRMQTESSIHRRYYVIWEYEGDSKGQKSNDVNEIYRQMESVRFSIRSLFMSMGHIVITPPDVNWYVHELLYKFFNPKSSISESFYDRFMRLYRDDLAYNDGLKKSLAKQTYEEDYVAPRGIKRKTSYIIMDGQYHTFITLRDNGHPKRVVTGWTNILSPSLGYDVDILAEKMDYDRTIYLLEQSGRIQRVQARKKIYNKEKYEELTRSTQNKEYISNRMKSMDEDLWNCLIIVTIRGDSYTEMMRKKEFLVKSLQAHSIYTEDSFLTVWPTFKMTMPFMYFDKELFKKNKRNYLSSSMAATYNMTAFELYNEEGVVIGSNLRNDSICCLNNFDTQIFSNANMLLIGASGSGKTFTECLMSGRMRLTGMRTFFVLPIKGYEYANAIKAVGGEMVRLYPGGQNCINIMQIRPEVKINKEVLGEDVVVEKTPLLTKKIASLTAFLQLLMGKEEFSVSTVNKLNSIITEVYKRFAITEDNNSIYRTKDHDILKEMPILQDLYDALRRQDDMEEVANVLLPFIEGTCQNFNGQTNVDLSNKCLAFDVDEDVVGEVFLPAFMYIAFDCVYDLVKQDMYSKDVIFLDEAWKMMNNDLCAKQVQKMVKLVRGYAGSVCIATQDIEDFMNTNEFGRAIITNTEIKIFLKMKEMEIKAISEIVNLTNEDKMNMRKFQKGYGMIYFNGEKIPIEFKASKKEIARFTTDVNVKKQLAMAKKKKKKIK